nr:PREDICTED: uncharacterized protein C9orf40 homolog [Anolis carolinensis]|eukprot:XP_008101490.1 PREDICTED: uncharacterized protein C9orf40 homolog [Anolis carolinensis]
MAKRRAEALALGAPCARFFPPAPRPKRRRSDLEQRCAALRWGEGGCCPKRKREAMEGEGGGGGRGGHEEEEAAPQNKRRVEEAEAEASGPPDEEKKKELAASPARENEDDVWCYNSFQYWRSPLPTINLSDILDLESKNAVADRDSSSIGLSEMET